MPPATTTSASPALMAAAASMMAFMPEPQTRLTVVAGMGTGSPAGMAAWRGGGPRGARWQVGPRARLRACRWVSGPPRRDRRLRRGATWRPDATPGYDAAMTHPATVQT